MPAVEVEDLRKSYGGRAVVCGAGFQVDAGEIFALLGPNGAGKTTTLEILEGFRRRDDGRVRVLGRDPGVAGDGRWLRERVGVVLQDVAVEPYLTVRETIARNAGYYSRPRPVGAVIDLVGLEGKSRQKVKDLSGGQKRRLDLALGVIGDPDLLFLDEPTTGFDPNARHHAWDLVKRLAADGTTIVLTTHYMDEAEALADRVAVIGAGRILATGTPESIGGRAVAQTRISFLLPHGLGAADLPVPVDHSPDPTVALDTDEPVAVLHRLTSWALEHGHALDRLRVERPSLESVYLELTATGTDQENTQEQA